MGKYSFELKLKVVQEYLEGKGGYKYLCKKYDISDSEVLHRWVAAYQAYGEDGIMRKRKYSYYTYEFKLQVVKTYLSTEISYQELALQNGINNPPLITRWVNVYRIAGPEALKPKRKGKRPKVTNKKQKKHKRENLLSENTEYLKQLEEKNLMLRIENAYLKESRRLKLKEKLQKESRELSTISEKNSS